jgi:Cft2 family RNA processing exonuclease
MLTGWAMDRGCRFRYRVDEAIPLSDHADFQELIALVRQARPAKVYTVHGFSDFAKHLRLLGFDAVHLG